MDLLTITEIIAYISASLAAILYIADTLMEYSKEKKKDNKPLPLSFRNSIKKRRAKRKSVTEFSPKEKDKTIVEINSDSSSSDCSPSSNSSPVEESFLFEDIYE